VKVREIEAFQIAWSPQDKPGQRRDSIVLASWLDHRAVVMTDGWKLIDSTAGGDAYVSYDSANRDIADALGTDRGVPKQLFHLPTDLGEDANVIAGITDVTAIRSKLVLETGRDLLARLDQYRTTPTSSVFAPFPDNDLDGMPNWFENRHVGLSREKASDAPLDFDGDGLSNLEEYQNAADPNNPDSDGDGVSDGDEVHTRHTDPTKAGP